MEIKLLSGRKLNSAKPQPTPDFSQMPEEQQKQEGPGILGRLGFSALKGLEAPGHAIDALLQLLGEPKLMRGPTLSQDIQQGLGYQNEQLLPQGALESYAQRFLGQAPSALALGGAAPINALKSLGLGTGVASGLELAGAPQWAQDVGQLATEVSYGLKSGAIPTLKSQQKKAYEQARSLVPEGENYTARYINQGINNVKDALKTETNESIVKPINHAIETIQNNLSHVLQRANPKTIMDLRRKLYRNVKNLPEDAYEYSKTLTDSLNQFFADYSARNPEFYKKLSRADQFTQLKNMNSYIGDVAASLGSYFAPSSFPKGKKITKDIFGNIFGKTIGGVEKFIRRVATSPLAREHYFDVVKSASNPQLFIKNLEQLDNVLTEEELNIPIIENKPKTSVKLLTGKKIS